MRREDGPGAVGGDKRDEFGNVLRLRRPSDPNAAERDLNAPPGGLLIEARRPEILATGRFALSEKIDSGAGDTQECRAAHLPLPTVHHLLTEIRLPHPRLAARKAP